jgi:hypothetical protein
MARSISAYPAGQRASSKTERLVKSFIGSILIC